MNRRAVRNDQTAPSLFPFLAVLICTMGAIIVLLVLVVKRADVQAEQATQHSADEIEAKIEEAQDKLELANNRVEMLKGLRPALKERLDQERGMLGHLTDHVARLRSQHDALKAELERLVDSDAENELNLDRENEINELREQIANARTEIDQRKAELAKRPPSFAIIPRSGGGSTTFRRPIFVECSAQGVVLQPYGIVLKADDFRPPLTPGNPLDVALLMIRDYWNQLDPNQKNGQPYPLFVVRPSGTRAFAACRKAMKSWVDEFGYELVTDEIQISYPPTDDEFARRLNLAIDRVREKQSAQIANLQRAEALQRIRQLDNRSRGGYRASQTGGGFVRTGPSKSGGGTSAAELESQTVTKFANDTRDIPSNNQASQTGRSNVSNTADGTRRNSGFQPGFGQSSTSSNTSSMDDRSSRPFQSQLPSGTGSQFDPRSSTNSQRPESGMRQENGTTSGAGNSGRGASGAGNLAAGSSFAQPETSGQNSPAAASQESSNRDANEMPQESIARRRGKNWALPSKANNAIQVRKPIKIILGPQAIQIMEIGKGIKEIPYRGNTAGAVPGLVEQVWKHIDAWGIAGANSYWKPELVCYVAPDAEQRYRDLETLLTGSGLDIRQATRQR